MPTSLNPQPLPPADDSGEYVARYKARILENITEDRLEQGIASGEIRVKYKGVKTVLVHRGDVRRLISTPPSTNA